MKIHINEPLEIFGADPWQYIADYSNPDEYAVIDLIFRFLIDEIGRNDLPANLRNKTIDQLQAEYARRFPILFGNALQDIGAGLVSGDIPVEIDFSIM